VKSTSYILCQGNSFGEQKKKKGGSFAVRGEKSVEASGGFSLWMLKKDHLHILLIGTVGMLCTFGEKKGGGDQHAKREGGVCWFEKGYRNFERLNAEKGESAATKGIISAGKKGIAWFWGRAVVPRGRS